MIVVLKSSRLYPRGKKKRFAPLKGRVLAPPQAGSWKLKRDLWFCVIATRITVVNGLLSCVSLCGCTTKRCRFCRSEQYQACFCLLPMRLGHRNRANKAHRTCAEADKSRAAVFYLTWPAINFHVTKILSCETGPIRSHSSPFAPVQNVPKQFQRDGGDFLAGNCKIYD